MDQVRSSPLGSTPSRDRLWRVGVIGARNSGKTCFWTALYGFRSSKESTINFSDDATVNYLDQRRRGYLSLGERPPGNPLAEPMPIHFCVKTGKESWNAVTSDYSGELIERISQDEAIVSLKQETRSWIDGCDAILYFLEPSDESRERLYELNAVLHYLSSSDEHRPSVSRPLALVFTKWDTTPGFKIPLADSSCEFGWLMAHISPHRPVGQALHTVASQAYQTVRHSGQNVSAFPVSAFGSSREGALPPRQLEPFNLQAPLHWSLKRCEEIFADKIRSAVTYKFSWKPWKGYDQALVDFAVECQRQRFNPDVEQRLRESRFKLRIWAVGLRILSVTAAAACVLIAICAGSVWSDQTRFVGLERNMVNGSVAGTDKLRMCDDYLAQPNAFTRVLGHRKTAWGWRVTLSDELSTVDFNNLVGFRASHNLEIDARKRFDQDQDFLAKWSGTPPAIQARLFASEDGGIADELEAYNGVLRDNGVLIAGGKYPEALAKCDAFFKNSNNPSHRALVLEKSQGDAGLWDRDQYRQLRNTVAGETGPEGMNSDQVERAKQEIDGYLRTPCPVRKMRTQVAAWQQWFQKLQKKANYTVTISELKVDKNGKFSPWLNADAEVRLDFRMQAQVKGPIGPLFGWDVRPKNLQTNMDFVWGSNSTFYVHAVCNRAVSNDQATFEGPEDGFPLRWANGDLSLKDDKGNVAAVVTLSCPEVIPPPLPPYNTDNSVETQ